MQVNATSFKAMEKQLWASVSLQLGEGCTRDTVWLTVFSDHSEVELRESLISRHSCTSEDTVMCVRQQMQWKAVWIMCNLPAEGFQTGLHVTPSSNSVIPPNLSLFNCELRIKEFLAHVPKGWTLRHMHAKCQPFHFASLWTTKVYHL